MGWLDGGVDPKDFEAFKAEVNRRFTALSEEIKRKATDSEETAKVAAANAEAAEQRIRAGEQRVTSALSDLEKYRDQALAELQNLQKQIASGLESNKTLADTVESNKQLHAQVSESKKQADANVSSIAESFAAISKILAEAQQLPQSVDNTKKLVEEAKGLNLNLQNLLTHSMKRKSDIDELYKSIFGHDVTGADGKVEHVDGLKDELSAAYGVIEDKTERLEGTVNHLIGEITEQHTQLLDKQVKSFEQLVSDSNARIKAVNDELKALLPGGLAAGLSAAYEAKKDEEIKALKRFELWFFLAIIGLVGVSLIPFGVDIYLLKWKEMDLLQVIQDTPSLIVAILPLYFPVLWLAYSTNKKLNLSKRLIEEYTHKAVLGKTFSGLANQIETLPHESAVKEELRTRLLFNVLQVSAENPGKLITDYHKSDHPLMEALENSAKLSDSVESLSKIPGLSSLAKRLSEKSDELFRNQEKKVEAGFVAQDAMEVEANPKPS